jgi:hypothetical protein
MESNTIEPTGDNIPIRKRRKLIAEEEDLSQEDLAKIKKLEDFFIQRIKNRYKEWTRVLGGFSFQIFMMIILIIVLIDTIANDHSYDYYIGVRWCMFIVCSLFSLLYFTVKLRLVSFISLAVAIVFNPFILLRLDRFSWQIMDAITIVLLFIAIVIGIVVLVISYRERNIEDIVDEWLLKNGSALIYGNGGVYIVKDKLLKDESVSPVFRSKIEKVIFEISKPMD